MSKDPFFVVLPSLSTLKTLCCLKICLRVNYGKLRKRYILRRCFTQGSSNLA